MLVNPEMYEDSACFDPNSMQESLAEDSYSQTHVPNYHHPPTFSLEEATTAAEAELQHQLNMEMEQQQNPGWDLGYNTNYHHQQEDRVNEVDIENNGFINNNPSVSLPNMPYPPTQDLLNLFHLPRCSTSSLLPNSSISFTNQAAHDSSNHVMFDPLLPLNLPPQPPFFRELFQSMPHGFNLNGSRSGSIFGGVDIEREVSGDQLYHEGDGVLEFGREINGIGKGRDGKDTKHYTTEKHRREQLNGKFDALKLLLPVSTKPDRASIVGDAINYINELKRTVEELKILMERKRCTRGRNKRKRAEDGDSTIVDGESNVSMKPHAGGGDSDGQAYNGSSSLRSSWLQRKSKNTEVDVRIVDDEVTIKLVQQKRINCLLFVSKVLDELQLDLHHVAGGLIGDFYSFLFNTKIYEGSSVYASAIANKLIEVVDRQYASIPASNSY